MTISGVCKKTYILFFLIFSFTLYSYPVYATQKTTIGKFAPHVKFVWENNSCWYHSALQCFFATKELTEKMLKLPEEIKLTESLSDIEKEETALKEELEKKQKAYDIENKDLEKAKDAYKLKYEDIQSLEYALENFLPENPAYKKVKKLESDINGVKDKLKKLPKRKEQHPKKEKLLSSYVNLLKTVALGGEVNTPEGLKDKDRDFRKNLIETYNLQVKSGNGPTSSFCRKFVALFQRSSVFKNKQKGVRFIEVFQSRLRDVSWLNGHLKAEGAPNFLVVTNLRDFEDSLTDLDWLNKPWCKKEWFSSTGEKYSIYAMVVGTGAHVWAYAQDWDTKQWWYYDDLAGKAEPINKPADGDKPAENNENAEKRVIDHIFSSGYDAEGGSPVVLFYRREDNLADKVSGLADSLGGLKTSLTKLSSTLTSVQKSLAVK